jgi:hypothetical protein
MYNSHDSHKKSKILNRLCGLLWNEPHTCSKILGFYESHACCTVDLRLAEVMWTYHVMWSDATLCDTMLQNVIKCHHMLCDVLKCHVILCDIMLCEVICFGVMWCEASARIWLSFASMYNSHDSHKNSKILERLCGSLLNELHKCSNILDFYESHDCCTVDLRLASHVFLSP